VPLLVVGVVAGAAPVMAGARPRPVGPAASFTVSGSLGGVAATSASNAWAVGSTGSNTAAKTMIVRWNGTAWARVPTPTPAGGAYLSGVTATSATSAWAVGQTGTAGHITTLILPGTAPPGNERVRRPTSARLAGETARI
jgi:hypothetical protein